MARFVVPVALAAVGIWILREGIEDDDDDEVEKARGLLATRGFAVIGLGLGVSMDELAIGFTISLAGMGLVTLAAFLLAKTLAAT